MVRAIYLFESNELKFKVAAKLGDVTLRRSAEKLLVLAAEVRWVFISNTETGARRIQIFAEHQTARFQDRGNLGLISNM